MRSKDAQCNTKEGTKGYRRSGDFDKSGELGENGNCDEFRRRSIELEIGVPTKRRF